MELTVIHLSCNIFSLKEQGRGLDATLCGDWLHYSMCTDNMSQPHHISLRWISAICIEVQVPMGRIDLPYFYLRRSSHSGGTGLVKLMVKILNAEEKDYWKNTLDLLLYAIWVLACFDKILTGDKLCGTLSLFRDWDW